jgi:hypothetical protein
MAVKHRGFIFIMNFGSLAKADLNNTELVT